MRYLRSRNEGAAALVSDAKSGSSADHPHSFAHGHGHGHGGGVNVDPASPQAHFDVMLLEAGIIFHSVGGPRAPLGRLANPLHATVWRRL